MRIGRKRVVLGLLVGAVALVACAPPATWPGSGAVPQTAPLGANGLAFAPDGTLWIADVVTGQLIETDPDTGEILRRSGPFEGQHRPDDLAFTDTGDLLSTGFADGTLDRLEADGTTTVVEQIGNDPNPVTISDTGDVYVGTELGGRLYEVDLDRTTPPELLATGQPEINGFDMGPDGGLYFPVRSVSSTVTGALCKAAPLLCPADQLGEIRRYDPSTGAITTVVHGLSGPAALKFDELGELHFVENTAPARLATADLATGDVTTKATLPGGIVDNLAFAPDGRIFISRFVGANLAVVHPDGSTSTLHVGG